MKEGLKPFYNHVFLSTSCRPDNTFSYLALTFLSLVGRRNILKWRNHCWMHIWTVSFLHELNQHAFLSSLLKTTTLRFWVSMVTKEQRVENWLKITKVNALNIVTFEIVTWIWINVFCYTNSKRNEFVDDYTNRI